jgi:hypothetical protein
LRYTGAATITNPDAYCTAITPRNRPRTALRRGTTPDHHQALTPNNPAAPLTTPQQNHQPCVGSIPHVAAVFSARAGIARNRQDRSRDRNRSLPARGIARESSPKVAAVEGCLRARGDSSVVSVLPVLRVWFSAARGETSKPLADCCMTHPTVLSPHAGIARFAVGRVARRFGSIPRNAGIARQALPYLSFGSCSLPVRGDSSPTSLAASSLPARGDSSHTRSDTRPGELFPSPHAGIAPSSTGSLRRCGNSLPARGDSSANHAGGNSGTKIPPRTRG